MFGSRFILAVRATWVALGLLFAFLGALGPLWRGNWADASEPLVNGLVVAMIGSTLFVPGRLLWRILLISLVAISGLYALERVLSRHAWMTAYAPLEIATANAQFGNSLELEAHIDGRTRKYRAWRVPAGTKQVRLTGRLDSLDGPVGWWWHSLDNSADLQISPNDSAITLFTPTAAETYIYKRLDSHSPIAGRSFRALVPLRSPIQTQCGSLYLSVPDGSARLATPICAETEWTQAEIVWMTPTNAPGTVLDVILNNFDGHTLELGLLTLEEHIDDEWVPLMSLSPNGVVVSMTRSPRAPWTKPPAETAAIALTRVLGEIDNTFSIESAASDLGDGDKLWVIAEAEPGVSAKLSNIYLSALNGVTLSPVAPVVITRQSWPFLHPNFAGHVFVLAALAVAILSKRARPGVIAMAFGLLLATWTGSRSALIVCLASVGFAALLPWLRKYAKRLPALSVMILISAVVIVSGAPALLTQREFGRLEIWQSLFETIRSSPLLGIGSEGTLVNRAGQLVSHAHNIWLQGLWQGGLFGFLSAVLISLGLLHLASRAGDLKVTAFAGAVLALQIADFTLFYVPVIMLVIGTINSALLESRVLKRPPAEPPDRRITEHP